MKIVDGWLDVAEQHESKNCDERPDKVLDLIVVHCISLPAGHFGGNFIKELFCNEIDLTSHADFQSLKGMKVSSHLLIRRTGQILQFVPFHRRAWHAGKSVYQSRKSDDAKLESRENCNDFSIGIELEGTDSSYFNDVQYERLSEICQLLINTYSIPSDNIVGHSDIAPGRKN